MNLKEKFKSISFLNKRELGTKNIPNKNEKYLYITLVT